MCICSVLKHQLFLKRLQKVPYSKLKSVIYSATQDEIKALVEILINTSEVNLSPEKRRLINK
jgi:hypothetical protein